MGAFVKFETFVGDLGNKVHDLDADGIKVYLTNATPSTSLDSVKADLAEIANGNGYATGGIDIGAAWSESTGVGTLTATGQPTWTASGGNIGPFQHAVLYNDTPTSPADPLIGYWSATGAITLTTGESVTVSLVTSGVFTIT